MASTPQLLIKVLVDNAAAKKDLDDLSKSFDDFGKKAAAAFAAVAAAAAVGVNKSVHAFSDLHEAQMANIQLFGDAADGVMEFAKAADTGLGMSQRQALDAAAQFGLFGKEAGLTGDELVKFSTTLVALGADLASFKNTSPEQALNAIGSALAGQIRPLRNYAVLLSAAAVEQEALNMGLFDGKGEMTASAKTLATYSLIMKKTTTQQGDFLRTSEDLANAERVFSAQVENATAALGMAFYPIAKSVMKFLNTQFIPVILEAVEGFRVFFMVLTGADVDPNTLGKWAGPMLDAARKVHDFYINSLKPALENVFRFLADSKDVLIPVALGFAGLATAISGVAAQMWALKAVWALLKGSAFFNPWILAAAGLATAILLLWKHSERFREIITGAFNKAREAVQPLIDKVVELWGTFQDNLPAILTLLSDGWSALLDAFNPLLDFFGKLKDEVVETIGEILAVIQPWTDKIKGFLTGLWDNLFPAGVVATAIGWVGGLVGAIQTLWDAFQEKLPGIIRTIREWKRDFIAALPGVLTELTKRKDDIVSELQKLWDAFQEKLPGILATLEGWKADVVAKFEELKGAIAPKIDSVVTKIQEIATAFTVADKPEILGGWIENIEGWWADLQPTLETIKAAVFEFKDRFLEAWAGLMTEIAPQLETLSNAWTGLKNALGDLWDELEPIVNKFLEWMPTILKWVGLLAAALLAPIGALVVLWTNFETFRNVVNKVIQFVIFLLAGFVMMLEGLVDITRVVVHHMKGEWDKLQGFIDAAVGTIQGIIEFIWEPMLTALGWAWNVIVFVWNGMVSYITGVKRDVENAIKGFWDPLWGTLQDVWKKITGFFANIKIPIPSNPFSFGGNMAAPSFVAPVPVGRAAFGATTGPAPTVINVTVTHTGLGIDSPKLQRDLVAVLARYEAREGRVRV
jgi:phage-related protein